MKTLQSICHIATLFGGVLAFEQLINVVSMHDISAPQQAGAMAVALGYVVIPYCFARAFEQLTGR